VALEGVALEAVAIEARRETVAAKESVARAAASALGQVVMVVARLCPP